MTIIFTQQFIDKLKLEYNLLESDASFFAASDFSNEIVGFDKDFNNGISSLAVWGIDSLEQDDDRDFIGLEDNEPFSVFVIINSVIYQISKEYEYSQNGIEIVEESVDLIEVCTLQESNVSEIGNSKMILGFSLVALLFLLVSKK
tara:strand:- start:87 stop:521 length:435 start_codon:yes stop_codon:yes gene_type:complete